MPIKASEITAYQRDQILKIKEGHFSDIKSIDIKPSKLTKTLSAFANADGGELHIGIDEEKIDRKKVRKWRGFPDQEAANGHIQAFETIFPLGQYFTYTFLSCKHANGLILKIEVYKTRDIKKASDRTVWFYSILVGGSFSAFPSSLTCIMVFAYEGSLN